LLAVRHSFEVSDRSRTTHSLLNAWWLVLCRYKQADKSNRTQAWTRTFQVLSVIRLETKCSSVLRFLCNTDCSSHVPWYKMTVFWDVSQCSIVEMTDVSDVLTASIIRSHRTSEISVNFHETTRRSIPELFFKPVDVWEPEISQYSNSLKHNSVYIPVEVLVDIVWKLNCEVEI
jgi:hypothetical protein